MPRIYVSSRRSDSASIPGRIISKLADSFGAENITVSSDTAVSKQIEQAVSACDVVVVIIGSQWTSIVNSYGFSSLFDPEDFVRLEIETALRSGRRIIPVLVNTDVMPSKVVLPAALAALASKQPVLIRDTAAAFVADMESLIEVIRGTNNTALPTVAVTNPISGANGNSHHVFLSYSRKDTKVMHRIRDGLREVGLGVWTDDTLEPGTSAWERAISAAIRSTECLVVILSPDAEQSTWVGRELAMAETLEKRIFPVLVRGSERDAVPIRLMSHQWVDARNNYQDAFTRLSAALRKHLSMT
jgi:hypothetical protein